MLLIIIISSLLVFGCAKKAVKEDIVNNEKPEKNNVNKPALSGKLVYHSYSCYECNDSKIFLYDFSSNMIKTLSDQWDIINPMNAHFSPKGDKLVFMGIDPSTKLWDVYIYKIDDRSKPINLTSSLKGRNEDPKFSSDASCIIFKHNGTLAKMDTLGNSISQFPTLQKETSMPYFIQHDHLVLYASETDAISSIYSYTIETGSIKAVFSASGIYAYYPVAISDSSFIFTRWFSKVNHHDQLFIGYINDKPISSLIFNDALSDYSDACPVGQNIIILSSTRAGTIGGYDLYLADIESGSIWSLNVYYATLNSKGNELGASYHP